MSVLLFMKESGGNPLESVIMTTEDENSMFDFRDGKPVRKLSHDSHSIEISEDENDGNNTNSRSKRASSGPRRRTLSSDPSDMMETEGSSSSSASGTMMPSGLPPRASAEEHSQRSNRIFSHSYSRKTVARTHSHSSGAAAVAAAERTTPVLRGRNRSSSRSGGLRRTQSMGAGESPNLAIGESSVPSPSSPPRPPRSTSSATPTRTLPDAKQPQLRLTQVGAILGANAPGGAQVVKAVNKAHERKAQRQLEKKSLQESAASSQVHLGFLV